jgi:hypothetical protein
MGEQCFQSCKSCLLESKGMKNLVLAHGALTPGPSPNLGEGWRASDGVR